MRVLLCLFQDSYTSWSSLPGEAFQDLIYQIRDSRRRRSSRVQGFQLRLQRKLGVSTLQGEDHLRQRLTNGGLTRLAGDFLRLALDTADQLCDMLQERGIAMEVPGMIVGDNRKGRHTQFS